MPLTDLKCKNAKPGIKPLKIFDGRGLYLELAPSGGKWWRLKFRIGGKEKRLSLGVYTAAGSKAVEVGLEAARKAAEEARQLVRAGVDPSHERKAQKAAQAERDAHTFEKVTREWFEKFSPSWVPAHAARKLRLFERDVFPTIGTRPVAALEAPELLAVLRQIEARGVLVTERRALVAIRQVLSYAFASGLVKHNVAADLKGAIPPAPGSHFTAVVTPEALAPILRAIESYGGTLPVRCALRLMPLLFVRPGELRRMEWSEIDLDADRWLIPAEKMKMRVEHLVPLARQAVSILKELQPLTGRGRYVFPSARSAKRPMSDAAVLAAMRRMDIPAETTTGHGFRASARTLLDEQLHVRPDLIECQLAHAVKDANGRAYNRTSFLPERAAMMQQWANYLDGLKTAKVLSFPQQASA